MGSLLQGEDILFEVIKYQFIQESRPLRAKLCGLHLNVVGDQRTEGSGRTEGATGGSPEAVGCNLVWEGWGASGG